MSKKLTKQKLNKLISEDQESMTYSVPADDQNAIDKAKEASKTDGVDSTVELTTEENMSEALKMGMSPILDALTIDMTSKTPEERQSIKSMIKQFVDILNQKGVTNLVLREDDEEWEIEDFEKADREVEYGVKSESFDKIMEELKKSNAPTINLKENIRPRIKKGDLINYIKNKK